MDNGKKIVLITGASSGIGLATTVYLARSGYMVYAGARNLEKMKESLEQVQCENLSIEILPLDLLDAAMVNKGIDSIVEKKGRIDVLVNNAGYGLIGFLEELTMEEIKAQFETNFFAQISLIQKIIPVMRSQKEGRIINVSSIYAQYAFPLTSIYSATKFSIEAITDALRMELASFGIQVATIQPSGIKTNFSKAASFSVLLNDPNSAYLHVAEDYVKKMKSGDGGNSSPEVVAKKIYQALEVKKMKRRYLVGDKAYLLAFLKFILPFGVFEKVFKRSFNV